MIYNIGGFWPEVQFIVDVLAPKGVSARFGGVKIDTGGQTQVFCTVMNVPFAGTYDTETEDLNVGCLWSDSTLATILAEAQQWENVIVVSTTDEQEQLINERLHFYLKDSPWNFVISPPDTGM